MVPVLSSTSEEQPIGGLVPTDLQTRLLGVHMEWFDRVAARDVDWFETIFADDVVLISNAAGVYEKSAYYERVRATTTHDHRTFDLSCSQSGDACIVRGRYLFHFEVDLGGGASERHLCINQFSAVWKRVDDDWKLWHVHATHVPTIP
jgi:ketosteroid isomerase-like protein